MNNHFSHLEIISSIKSFLKYSVLYFFLNMFGGTAIVHAQNNDTSFVRGTWDDIQVSNNDLLSIEQVLMSKWTYFLVEMDKYNRGRDSKQNDLMISKMKMVFADHFSFFALNADSTPFGKIQGNYSPESWILANDVVKTFGKKHYHRGLFVPNYLHTLTVEIPGKRVRIEGYHEHSFTGALVKFVTGAARQLAYETIIFEKSNDVWRITNYIEVIYDVSEFNPPSLNPHGKR